MLLAVDIGNTNTVVGAFDGDQLVHSIRITTSSRRTVDETFGALHQLFSLSGFDICGAEQSIVCSVVPAAAEVMSKALSRLVGAPPTVVGPGVATGLKIKVDNPREVGADRVVNAVAASADYPGGSIVVDFGTATTFDCVGPGSEYLGGAICPGIGISADALYQRAAKLPRVAVVAPKVVVGRTTEQAMQSGLYFGYVGLIDGVVARMRDELPFSPYVLATGGLATLFARHTTTIQSTDELLTLRGLVLIQRLQ